MKEIIETIIACVIVLSLSSSMFMLTWFLIEEWLEEKWLPLLAFAILTSCAGFSIIAWLFINLF